ncbi:META domain-containing protein [Candidatus Kaiserbacteria bacterium]|nr:META domain-containing protein [Candidatus Kaiserbacteria bacterium]
MKHTITLIVIALLLFVGWWYIAFQREGVTVPNGADEAEQIDVIEATDPLNTTYDIDGEAFALVDGLVQKSIAPDSASKNTVRTFGEPAYGDIDGDGDDDAVLILVQDFGGSGTFYYVAVAVNDNGIYKGTDTILLGDRISPQNYSIFDGRAEVNYVVRQDGEDFSVPPSEGKTLHLQVHEPDLHLIEVEVDFPGESNPELMTLSMKEWTWVKTTYNNDTELAPNQTDTFKLNFSEDTVAISTDCNSLSGNYTVEGNQITFGPMMSTRMFCEGSQEQEFAGMLMQVQSFFFTSKGELIFDLKFDSGSVVFR